MIPEMMPPMGAMDGKKEGTFSMNVTIVDARETGKRPQSILDIHHRHGNPGDKEEHKQVNVVSSWVLFHMPGNHTDSLKKPTLPKLVGGLRDAIADALEVCRSSVGIVDMRAINIDVIDKYDNMMEDSKKDSSDDDGGVLLEHAAKWGQSRSILRSEDQEKSHVNVTQIKAVYEVRMFEEMRTSDPEVGRRVDKFQIYSKFSDLNRLLSRSLAAVDGMDNVMLDDVGYASRHNLLRPALTHDDLMDCAEEVMLHDARQIHQFIVAVSLLMVALITCAGSTVFTIKHASSVPSRMNPLVQVNTN